MLYYKDVSYETQKIHNSPILDGKWSKTLDLKNGSYVEHKFLQSSKKENHKSLRFTRIIRAYIIYIAKFGSQFLSIFTLIQTIFHGIQSKRHTPLSLLHTLINKLHATSNNIPPSQL